MLTAGSSHLGLLYALQTMLVEAASGHTGMCIGLCYAACQTGHRVALFLPDPTLSPARHELLRQLGAIVVITNARGGMLVGNYVWQFASIF